jgi:hypothetical protein
VKEFFSRVVSRKNEFQDFKNELTGEGYNDLEVLIYSYSTEEPSMTDIPLAIIENILIDFWD